MTAGLLRKSEKYLNQLCIDIHTRTVGTEGNIKATELFAGYAGSFGFEIRTPEFECMDWICHEIKLEAGTDSFEIFAGPYSTGCDLKAQLCSASSFDELKAINAKGKIILLTGDIVKEQLMPKSFPFYNPDEHKEIYSILENSGASAVISATSRNPELAGGMYPFPFIEDGDFNIPTAYMKDTEGEKLLKYSGSEIKLLINSKRFASKGFNVIANKGNINGKKIIIMAHIDSKPGTPGAIDNATGITVLLLTSELLKNYTGNNRIEIVAINGEDYFSVPGQINYMKSIENELPDISLVINIDGAGYHKEDSAFSLYNCTENTENNIRKTFLSYKGITEGNQWIQSDHGMFVQLGIPALAVTSNNFMEKLSSEITHTPGDKPCIVDHGKLVEISKAISELIFRIK
jgi:aminopeptidase YwaD